MNVDMLDEKALSISKEICDRYVNGSNKLANDLTAEYVNLIGDSDFKLVLIVGGLSGGLVNTFMGFARNAPKQFRDNLIKHMEELLNNLKKEDK